MATALAFDHALAPAGNVAHAPSTKRAASPSRAPDVRGEPHVAAPPRLGAMAPHVGLLWRLTTPAWARMRARPTPPARLAGAMFVQDTILFACAIGMTFVAAAAFA